MPTTRISLVVATFGRCQQVRRLLTSLAAQTIPLDYFEVIVVDQNDDLDLSPVIKDFSEILRIRHVRSQKRGLSAGRNVGLALAEGEIVAFPDDDCTYYPDTLEKVVAFYETNASARVVLGCVYDRVANVPLIRRWPSVPMEVSKWNFYLLQSSVTIFSKEVDFRFDERLGVGTRFGSNEDADYLYRILSAGGKIYYEPTIQVWHPAQPVSSSCGRRVYAYGLGFGAFVAKNASVACAVLLAKALFYHLAMALKAACVVNFSTAKKHLLAVYSRVVGVVEFTLQGRVKQASPAAQSAEQ